MSRSVTGLGASALILGLTFGGCTKYVTLNQLPQAYYQTSPPAQDVSGALEEAFRTVRRIRVTGVYDDYRFSPQSAPLEGAPLGPEVLARAVDTARSTTSREASAVQVGQEGLKVTLITNQHPIEFPDTVVEYAEASVEERAHEAPRTVHRVSIKKAQYNLVLDRAALYSFEVLADDPQADLALLGVLYPTEAESPSLSVLGLRVGDSERLSWGSFVYVLGYPGGFPLVTRGIVSDPRWESLSSFLVDGLWNEGISGGPILAVRGEGGSLEWVGLARAAAGRLEYRLAPDPDLIPTEDQRSLYEGRIYLEEVQRILYGISFSVPMTVIRAFMDRNRPYLQARGWPLPEL